MNTYTVLYSLCGKGMEAVVVAPDEATAWAYVQRRHYHPPILLTVIMLEEYLRKPA
jgi:hypothetical protein